MNLDDTLELLRRDPTAGVDVAALALHLARDEYPELDVEAYLGELAGMAHEARRFLTGDLSTQVAGFCRYLFHEMGFRGNQQNYDDANNSYLNQVIDRRTGLPITLAVVAMAIGTRAGLNVVGVGLPGHFIAKAVDGNREVLFDPFHGGRVLTPADCETLVFSVTGTAFAATTENLSALPAGQIAVRLLNNLKGCYLRAEDYTRSIRTIGRIRQLTPDDPVQDRDLGISLLHSGQPGKAIDHLSSFLSSVDESTDADSIRDLLSRAQAEVAKWN